MCKFYRSCLNFFIQNHCESNKIVTDEQAGGKRGIWGCAEQILINKAVLKEVKKQRQNCLVRLRQGIQLSTTLPAIYSTAFS